jgi:hypothetical protein
MRPEAAHASTRRVDAGSGSATWPLGAKRHAEPSFHSSGIASKTAAAAAAASETLPHAVSVHERASAAKRA